MKKFFTTIAVGVFMSVSFIPVSVSSLFAEPASDTAALAQEAQRNRELLDIWKEHVKTLTRERDEAYKELESARASNRVSPAAQTAPLKQFGVESQAIPPVNRDLQMQFSTLQNQYQLTKKELDTLKASKEKSASRGSQKIPAGRLEDMQQRINELQKDNESLNRALVAAQNDGGSTVSQVRRLEAELSQLKSGTSDISALQEENRALQDEVARLKTQQPKGLIKGSGGQSSDAVSREKDAFMRQATKLQYENDTLKVQIEKSKVMEKELQSTRSYFAPMVEDLQNKNTKLNEEIEQLKAQIQKTQSDAQSATGTLESITKENEKLKADIQASQKAGEENDKQMELIKSQLQLASADKDKLKSQDEEMSKLADEKKVLEKAYEELQANFKSQDAQFQQVSQQMSAMQKASEEWKGKETQFSGDMSSMQQELEALRAERVKHLRSLERYQTVLRANFTDMQNLKSNFEAYLESLVASFEDRQK